MIQRAINTLGKMLSFLFGGIAGLLLFTAVALAGLAFVALVCAAMLEEGEN